MKRVVDRAAQRHRDDHCCQRVERLTEHGQGRAPEQQRRNVDRDGQQRKSGRAQRQPHHHGDDHQQTDNARSQMTPHLVDPLVGQQCRAGHDRIDVRKRLRPPPDPLREGRERLPSDVGRVQPNPRHGIAPPDRRPGGLGIADPTNFGLRAGP